MFKEVGRVLGGYEGFILQNMNWVIFKPLISRVFTQDPNLYAISSNTITITSIKSTQGKPNQIAQSVEAMLDCRLLSSAEDKVVIKEIRELLHDERIKIEIVDKGGDSYVSIPEKYYEITESVIKSSYRKSKVVPIFLPASSDNNYYRSKGIPVYGFIPLVFSKKQLNTIHNNNEHMPVSHLLSGVQFFEKLITAFIAYPEEKLPKNTKE